MAWQSENAAVANSFFLADSGQFTCLCALRWSKTNDTLNCSPDSFLTIFVFWSQVIRMTPFEVRSQLVTALQQDLVGPHDGLGNVAELLPQAID